MILKNDKTFEPVTTIRLDLKQQQQSPGIDDLNTIINKARHTFDAKFETKFRYILSIMRDMIKTISLL